MLRRGFQGLYRFEPIRGNLHGVLKEEPSKNDYSHPHDALQYIAHRIRFSKDYGGGGLYSLWGGWGMDSAVTENPTYGKVNAVIV